MNNPHQNARTTPLGRGEMVRRIVEEGRPVAEVAAGFGVSGRDGAQMAGALPRGRRGWAQEPLLPAAIGSQSHA